jgi:hypothetical protein
MEQLADVLIAAIVFSSMTGALQAEALAPQVMTNILQASISSAKK